MTDKLKTKFKKKTHIVEETKEAINKIEESEYIEFQSEVILIPEETEKQAKGTYVNVEVKDHEANISPLRRIPQRKRPERYYESSII